MHFRMDRCESGGTLDISLHHAGFLTYRHPGPPADVVTTRSALYQLPDFWKQTALLNIADLLKPGGLLYIWDVIFSFPPAEYAQHLQDFPRLTHGELLCRRR